MTDRTATDLNDLDLESWAKFACKAGDALEELSRKVRLIRPQRKLRETFRLNDLVDPEFCNAFVDWLSAERTRGVPMLYAFVMDEVSEYPRLADAFDRFRIEEGALESTCQLNAADSAQALYVGISKSLRQRISEHFGRTKSRQTSALRLRDWATGSSAKVEFTAWAFGSGLNPIELEALEQQLWDQLKPLLGKRSGK